MRTVLRLLPALAILVVCAGPASPTFDSASVHAQARAASPAPPGVQGTATLPAQRSAPLKVPFTQFALPNGLHVILHEDHTVPVVSVNTWYHVGSAREKPGRTGFAHLFEHLMFEGSANVKPGQFDRLLEGVGGDNNGSTNNDRTNYFMDVPSNAIETALFLESDRMGYLLDSLSRERVEAQRNVVKNERRQNYENRPYGMADIVLGEMLFPEGHPYHWPVIGYMEDLSAATYEDVVEFFRKYYGPNNASLVIAGDIDPAATRKLVEKWFSDVKRGAPVEPLVPPVTPELREVKRRTLTDQVQLPRLHLAWLTPALFKPGDAALDVAAGVLAGGKNSRLYKRLVYDMQIAQDVSAFQQSQTLASSFLIVVTPRPGHTVQEVQKVVDEELQKLRDEMPTDREFQRVLNQTEASFFARMERLGSFGGIADQLNAYYTNTRNPDYFNEDLGRYRALSPSDVRAIVRQYLPADRRVELVVMPAAAKGDAK